MAKSVTYPDLYTHKKVSILPLECQNIAFEIGRSLNSNSLDKSLAGTFRKNFGSLAPNCVPRAAEEIRTIAKLYRSYPFHEQNKSIVSRLKNLWKKPTDHKTVKINPDAGWIFIFHGDGFLRQSGLSSINSAPQSPFEFTAIVYRLNDWVENVRIDAYTYALLRFPETNSDIVAESVFFLLEQSEYLTRWNDQSKKLLEQELFRSDVLKNLREKFLEIRPGRLAYILSRLLRRPEFDRYLEELALNAKLPQVRAVAFDALLNERVIWTTGYKKIWIDKVYGISTRERIFETRKLSHPHDIQVLHSHAATDNSAAVRKIAANSLIAMASESIPTTQMRKLAISLSLDKSKSVRKSVEFYLNKVDVK